ncbi:hypothetical protein [Roseovarius sp. 2305UL8-3]|uniref:hypothetical protein n=1 Tax=Roseovarius conchicola TaxID=3121636 RepID=UPI0035277380
MKKTLPSRLFEVCASIPPIQPHNMLPFVIMIGLWMVLRAQGVSQDPAFVVSVVSAQAYLVWRNLPNAGANLVKMGSAKRRMLHGAVGLTLAIAVLQLWLSSPIFTQRVLTVICGFFLVVMVLGILREREVLERLRKTMPANGRHSAPVSLLRVNATMAALIIVANEVLIMYESPGVWITVMPLFMLVLHAIYWVLVLLTIPDTNDATPA